MFKGEWLYIFRGKKRWTIYKARHHCPTCVSGSLMWTLSHIESQGNDRILGWGDSPGQNPRALPTSLCHHSTQGCPWATRVQECSIRRVQPGAGAATSSRPPSGSEWQDLGQNQRCPHLGEEPWPLPFPSKETEAESGRSLGTVPATWGCPWDMRAGGPPTCVRRATTSLTGRRGWRATRRAAGPLQPDSVLSPNPDTPTSHGKAPDFWRHLWL